VSTALRVLLVDDDVIFLDVMGGALARRGYAVHTASDMPGVRERMAADTYDVILLDLMLAEGSALSFIPELRAAQPEAQIIMVTGYASIPTTVHAIKLGASNYLAKPVSVGDVLAVIDPRPPVDAAGAAAAAMPATDPAVAPAARPRAMSLRKLEWEHIQRVLDRQAGNLSAAARELGMHRRTLQRKLAKRPR